YQSMFELQIYKFCYGLPYHYFQQLTMQARGSRQPELIHVWLETLQGAPKKRLEWVFQQFFDAFEEVKDDLPADLRIRCDWLVGCLEYIRTQIVGDLGSLSLKTYLHRPLTEWPDLDKIPPQARARFLRLEHWRQSPFAPGGVERE
ncbi:MAG: hypothetical protein ACR2PT_21545, partial [Endozoicomonas sp.]